MSSGQHTVKSFNTLPKSWFPWFGMSLAGIWLFSLGLRLWGLDRFNTLVFDEVYYAKFAHNYLSQTPFFDGHPPLSKYIIAIGMWLGDHMPVGQTVKNGLTGGLYAPWTYRWLNALTGSVMPLTIAGIAYQLLHRRSFALIAALLAAWDGLFLVESRYALNNVYLVLFGLLGWWCLLLGLNCRQSETVSRQRVIVQRSLWFILSGIGFGASVAIKWNGLWFLLGAYGLWAIAQGLAWLHRSQLSPTGEQIEEQQDASSLPRSQANSFSPLQFLRHMRYWQWGLYLGVIPFLTYALSWIPHLQLNVNKGYWQDFWALQYQILTYHNQVGAGPTVHPYCSTWYSWLGMWRPVAYFYRAAGKNDPIPTEHVLPPTSVEKVIYDVHAIGNPFLWWFSTVAIAIVLSVGIGIILQQLSQTLSKSGASSGWAIALEWRLSIAEQWLILFLAVNYLANLLPWMRVTRCIFLYHYMGSLVFASLALAWLLDRWLQSNQVSLQLSSVIILMVIGSAFIYWMPIYLGLPVTPETFQRLMWFRSWI